MGTINRSTKSSSIWSVTFLGLVPMHSICAFGEKNIARNRYRVIFNRAWPRHILMYVIMTNNEMDQLVPMTSLCLFLTGLHWLSNEWSRLAYPWQVQNLLAKLVNITFTSCNLKHVQHVGKRHMGSLFIKVNDLDIHWELPNIPNMYNGCELQLWLS